MVISPTRELAKQINQTSIASDEQVLAMVTSLTREDCQVDQFKQALLLTSRFWRW